MQKSTHEYLTKLRIISKIIPGQRLDTTKSIDVYSDTWLSWIMRTYHGDSSKEATKCLTDLYESVSQDINRSIILLNKSPDNYDVLLNNIITICITLKNSIHGIENLSKTYNKRPKTTAELEGIIDDYAKVSYVLLINNIPQDKLPDELKKDIIYNDKIIFHYEFN